MPSTCTRRRLLKAGLGGCGSLALSDLSTQRLFADSPAQPLARSAQTTGGVVTSNSAAASDAGRDVLAAGGNAVDAAIATALALAVTWPEAGNLGGGGFMLVAPPKGPTICIDYRETAPRSVTATTFAQHTDRRHPKMVGVPGTVRGLAAAHQQFGSRPWGELVAPAIELARAGCVVDRFLAESINEVLSLAVRSPQVYHAPLKQIFSHPDQRPWRSGDVLKQPALARTLGRLADEGADEFYAGQTGVQLADFLQRHGGLVTREDLLAYKAVARPATQTRFLGFEVCGPPPPSSGGMTIQLALQMIEAIGLDDPGDATWTAPNVHRIAEAMRRAFRERAAHLGDPDFVSIPPNLSSESFARELSRSISLERATDSRQLAGDIPLTIGPPESPDTTHFSVVDSQGMAVANTYTLEASWGAWLVDPRTGFVLNNEMGDFNWNPGYTNLDGRIGTAANLVAPGKRMLSSQSPTLVKRDGQTILVTGSPGGRTIINTVLCILVQHLAFQRPLAQAIAAPRFHHQWLPDRLLLEATDEGVWESVREPLEAMGHRVEQSPYLQGAAHSIAVDPQTRIRIGVADLRRGGSV